MEISPRTRIALYQACTWLEATWAFVVRRAARLLGIQRPLTYRDLFLRQFLLHATGRQSPLRITVADRSDGAGAQAHTIMSAMNFARAFGHTYVHTPFQAIDHAERPMPEWVAAWEQLFKLGEGEVRADAGARGVLNYSSFHPRLYHLVSEFMSALSVRRMRISGRHADLENHFQPFLYHSDCQPDTYNAIIPALRQKYYLDAAPAKKEDVLRVAVHMRRGDVSRVHPQRYTPITAVAATLRAVKSVLESRGLDYTIELYSQGPWNDFVELLALGVQPRLNEDAVWTMQQLVEADILLMSKSSFTYVAALLSDGVKLYEPFWHSPMSHWVVCDRKGGFPAKLFEQELDRLLRDRRRPDPVARAAADLDVSRDPPAPGSPGGA
jgi:hypothetical protein